MLGVWALCRAGTGSWGVVWAVGMWAWVCGRWWDVCEWDMRCCSSYSSSCDVDDGLWFGGRIVKCRSGCIYLGVGVQHWHVLLCMAQKICVAASAL